MHVALRPAADVGCDLPSARQGECIVEVIGNNRLVMSGAVECEPLTIDAGGEVGRPSTYGLTPDKIEAHGRDVDVDGVHEQLEIVGRI